MDAIMEKFELLYEGKVREVYDIGDKLVIAATDRISAFDHILKNKVTDKGAILTQMSKFWFDYTKDVIPNHMISVDVKDMPEFFQNEKYARRSMMCKKLAIRRMVQSVELSFQKDLKSQKSFLNQSTHQVQRLRLVTMMKIFHLSRVLKY